LLPVSWEGIDNIAPHTNIRMKFNLRIASQEFKQVWLTLPYKVGVICVAYSKARFRYQNWLDTAPEPWKPRSKSAKRNKGRSILIDTGRLRRSIRIINTTSNSVTVGSDVPYAAVHNDGYSGTIQIPLHIRKRFKKDKQGTGVFNVKTRKERMKTVKKEAGETIVKAHTRKLNLPRRRFLGNSKLLRVQISNLIDKELMKIFRHD